MQKRNARSKTKNNIYTLDFETDPFLFGRIPKPFAACLYSPDTGPDVIWSNKCAEIIADKIRTMGECEIYAHNGGKFDFHYLLPFIDNTEVKIINGRLAVLKIGKAKLIDSYLLMPFPLAAYAKDDIDYNKFECDVREFHSQEIIRYLIKDCKYLHELVTKFHELGGKKLTVGSAAMGQLKKLHHVRQGDNKHDENFRKYYFGGRVEAIETGEINGPLVYLDINSAYPHAMTAQHPLGQSYLSTTDLPRRPPYFARVIAISDGCLPYRDNDKIFYPRDKIQREYIATGWEIAAGIKMKKLKIISVIECMVPVVTQNYKKYVDNFFTVKSDAKKSGDKITELFAKYMLNSAYGKFGTDPKNFYDYMLADHGDVVDGYEWVDDIGTKSIWRVSSYDGHGYYDVAIAASITGFVRASLFTALCQSVRPVYCDTDSIICKSSTVALSDKLGDWKIEGKIKRNQIAHIAGKKLYTLPCDTGIKSACKGARLTPDEISDIARGSTVVWENQAPTFSISSGTRFITRVLGKKRANVKKRNKK